MNRESCWTSCLTAFVFFVLVLLFNHPDSMTGMDLDSIDNISNQGVDVMILYTVAAQQYADAHLGGITNVINTAVQQVNQSFQDSGATVTLSPVYIGLFTGIQESETYQYPGTGGLVTDYYNLVNNLEVQSLRNTYGADLVQLMVNNQTALNQCYWGVGLDWGSITQVRRATAPYYTLAHEFGHSFGAEHHLGGIFTNSPRRYTIMAKDANNPCGTQRASAWSSANVTAINNNAANVANLRSVDPCFSTGTLFCDISATFWARSEVESAYQNNLTRGCGSGTPYVDLPFCPDELLDRAHTAVFLIRRVHENDPNYQPPGPYHGYFTDVPITHPQALWIEELYERGITYGSTGCSGVGLRYCPDDILKRSEIAAFLMRTEFYLGHIPDFNQIPLTGVFDDVPASNVHAHAIEYMYYHGFTNGCVGTPYGYFGFCPDEQLDRTHAMVFMARVFGFVSVNVPDVFEPDNLPNQANTPNLFNLVKSAGGDPTIMVPHQFSNLRTISTSEEHSIVPATDVEWIKFSLSSESAISLQTSGSYGDTRVWLYDNDLNELEYDDDDGPGYFSFIDRVCGVDALPAGNYLVKIDEYQNNDEIPLYNLSFSVIETCETAQVSIISVETTDGDGHPKTQFVAGAILGLGIRATNHQNSEIETFWDWIVTDRYGNIITNLSYLGFRVHMEGGQTLGYGWGPVIPVDMLSGAYTFIARVRLQDGSYETQSSVDFQVSGIELTDHVFLPALIKQ